MKNNTPPKLPYIFVIGNEKGGAGKTTCSMHLVVSLLESGFKVATIDTDSRQHSLSSYIANREDYNKKNLNHKVLMPEKHFLVQNSKLGTKEAAENEEQRSFEGAITESKRVADIIVIDTPGSHSFLSRLAHSYADTIITPINDSFIDIDVMVKIKPGTLEIDSPSIYSQMIWEQKMAKAKRDRGSINWIVMRNRLSNLDAVNKRNVAEVLEALSARISFTIASGFSERVIFRELFLYGLTLLDLKKANYDKSFNLSHVAARRELKEFTKYLNLEALKAAQQERTLEAI